MFWGFILIIVFGFHLYQTIQKSNKPEQLKEDFMWESGYTHSLIAFRYFFGKPKEGRAAIVNDSEVRKKYIRERLVIDSLGIGFGILVIGTTLCNRLSSISYST